MKNRSSALILLVLVSVVVAAASTFSVDKFRQQDAQKASPSKKRITFSDEEFESQYPIADFSVSEPADPAKKAKSKARDKRYNKKEQIPISEYATNIVGFNHCQVGLPALPVAQSRVVLIGRVKDAQAHLSSNKESVYSEFTVQLNEVLKKDSGEVVAPDALVTATRDGGRVRLPSGKIALQHIAAQGMPRVGQEYVFFLTRDDEEQDFHIVTAYELRGNDVMPVDFPGDHPINQYIGADKASFLSALRTAVASPQPATQN